jgi:UDPglucose--hexose-1-phosphate uridylyltransferase
MCSVGDHFWKSSGRLADGREIIYFDESPGLGRAGLLDQRPLTAVPAATAPPGGAGQDLAPAGLRWDALAGEWVIVAAQRQDRTFLPPPTECPLDPSGPGRLTEIPAPGYDVVVFENRFPSLRGLPPAAPDGPAADGPAGGAGPPETGGVPGRPPTGRCEVVCFTADHDASLATLPPSRVRTVLEAWADRSRVLAATPGIKQVYCFENRGEEIGVTLSHPHGQIYAYPFIPPVLERELATGARHMRETGRCLYCDVIAGESDGARTVLRDDRWIAFVPKFARWPYEVHLAPTNHRGGLADLDPEDDLSFATNLKGLLQKYDRLFDKPLPYVMAMHQRPPGRGRKHHHFHIEFYPPNRTRDKLKYLAGSELGAGAFILDARAEDTAAELRAL